jgi:hypothetical protein
VKRVATDDMGRLPETREVTREPKARKWDRSDYSLKYASYGAPNGHDRFVRFIIASDQKRGGRTEKYRRLRTMTPKILLRRSTLPLCEGVSGPVV